MKFFVFRKQPTDATILYSVIIAERVKLCGSIIVLGFSRCRCRRYSCSYGTNSFIKWVVRDTTGSEEIRDRGQYKDFKWIISMIDNIRLDK